MRLYRTCIALPYRRSAANVAHSVESTPYCFDLHKVHTIARNKLQRLVELHVRCRKAYSAAKPIACHDDPFERISVSKHLGCTFNISLLETLTNLGGTYRIAMLRRHHVGPDDLQTYRLGCLRHLVRAFGIASHPVVISKQNGLCAIVFNEHAKVLLRSHCAEVLRESKNLNLVHA